MAELLGLIIFTVMMVSVLKLAFKHVGFDFSKPNSNNNPNSTNMNIFNPLTLSIQATRSVLGILFGGFKNDGMMGSFERNRFFKPSNRGVVIDGKGSRLSEKDSFNHLGIVAKAGAGKSTVYIIPNILKLAEQNCSMVVTDLSGELYEKTSGYVASRGYKVYVLDPEAIEESIRYNPLYYAVDNEAIDLILEILIKSAYTGNISSNDKFWLDGAKTIISIFIRVLIRSREYKYVNLANVKHLLNNFGADGTSLDNFISKYADDYTFSEWRGFIKGNQNTVLSFISSAQAILSQIGINDKLKTLTASHTFDFKKLRQEKSIVYIRIPTHKQKQYNFLQNLFYTQLFNTVLEKLPNDRDLSIYCLLDEFGNTSIPNFANIITVIRKYRVSISIVLQDLSQLNSRYGKEEANSIVNGGISGQIYFAGADLDISSRLEKVLGNRYVERVDIDGNYKTYKEPVMSVRDIRTMKDDEVLFIYANKLPMKLNTTPYYKNMSLSSKTKREPYQLERKRVERVEYIDCDVPDADEYDPERDGYDYEE
jgi:type IV secretory pathway TraG/TraD family ATPase VirD4